MDLIFEPAPQTTSDVPQIQGKKFWPRAGAYAIDSLVLYGLTYLISRGLGYSLGIILYMITSALGRSFYVLENSTIGSYLIGLVQMIIYFAIFEWLFGRTLGKVILGMCVIKRNGDSPTLKQALIRSLYRLVDGLFLGIVAYSMMKPPSFQRLGDQKADTLVASANDGAIRNKPIWWKFLIALAVYLFLDSTIISIGLLAYVRFR